MMNRYLRLAALVLALAPLAYPWGNLVRAWQPEASNSPMLGSRVAGSGGF